VKTFRAIELLETQLAVPDSPGIYVLRSEAGCLYIGEAENLRRRLAKHLDHSDRKLLARYFWEYGFD